MSSSSSSSSPTSSSSSPQAMAMEMRQNHDKTPLNPQDTQDCKAMMADCEMFQNVPRNKLDLLIQQMTVRYFIKNEFFARQGQPCDRFFLVQKGQVRRQVHDEQDGKTHEVKFAIKANSLNTMRVLSGDFYHNSMQCISNDGCKLFEMKRDAFLKVLQAHPDLTLNMAEGLSLALRTGSKKYQTPFLQQQQQEINIPAVAIAAGIESYYRSALNSILNTRLTGVKSELFPQMHVQVPVRISYIVGFKGLRSVLDRHIDDADDYAYPNILLLGMALAPGILMTPIASILEASNAGHLNSEPLHTRWMRGVLPRGAREIIFGLGLNQMSDYFEERLKPMFGTGNDVMANAAGSLAAGVVSGYLSHVPHNLSTYKLLEPHKSYGTLYRQFVDKSVPPALESMCAVWPSWQRQAFRVLTATLMPRGLIIRTTQIVGSFMILNGTINYLHMQEKKKIRTALGM